MIVGGRLLEVVELLPWLLGMFDMGCVEQLRSIEDSTWDGLSNC